ncbi:hypothetical protein NL676_014042 [Syzygium grande]|nr:hypothetical protein NL676_014042 [Syzygium grande]
MRPAKDRNVKAPPSGIAKKVYKGRDKSVKRTGQLHHVLKEQGKYLLETEKELPAVQHSPAQRLDPLTKIKLQLFPIDEITRLGLQKDGHHPYLELTLKAQKRISSVLKHLQTKWGSLTIATGEPVLYPYSIEEAKSSPDRWTLDDKDVSAGDVHAAIGSPALFRLRYGWFSNAGSKSLDSEVTKTVGGVKDHEIMVDNLVDHPVDRMNTFECNEGGLGQSSEIWTDNLTNISIGGLLSEASLQVMFSSFCQRQMDTCMAFPFKKSSMSKEISTSNGSSNAGLSCPEIGARPCQFLKAAEDDIQIKIEPETFPAFFQESETTLQLCSRVYNDKSSLGLAGIKWTDTLGPFDLGLPSGKVINGDTISISGFVR